MVLSRKIWQYSFFESLTFLWNYATLKIFFDQNISFFEEKQNDSFCKFKMSDWKEVSGLNDSDILISWENTLLPLCLN